MDETLDDGVVAQPAARLRLPAFEAGQRTAGVNPGLLGQLAAPFKDQVGQGASAQVAGTDPFATVATGQGDALLAVAEHVRLETPGHAQVTAPGMGDGDVLELREQLAEQVAAQFDLAVGEVEVFPQAPGKAVAATGAEHQAIVGAALAIGDLAAVFAEGLAAVQANLLPDLLRQRFGGHNQALYRHLVMAQRRQADRVAFNGRHQPLTLDPCLRGAHFTCTPVEHRAVLVQAHAHALHCTGQAAHQFGRLNGCHIGIEDRPIGFADAQLAGQLLRAQPAVVVFVQALLVQLVQVGAKGRFLLWITCRAVQHAAFAVVAVDVLTFENALHFIGNAMQQVVGGAALLWRAGCEQAVLAQQVAHQPATIATGGAEAGDIGLNDGDVQLRGV
ncbi:hypothetical protein D3C77_320480 [compost metagenome]